MPVVLFDRAYWTRAIDFRFMAERGMIATADLDLFEMVDDPEEAWSSLRRRGLKLGETG
jgi:predicted Rossmann-fold nucleotide-binding protein